MYTGALPPVSNRASWNLTVEVVDDETGDLADLSAISIALEVRDPLTGCAVLSGSTATGQIVIPSTGTFIASFTRDEMASLSSHTYEIGVTLADTQDTSQLILGTLPVLYGVMSK